ncbi:MAG: sulfatase-like hydrolase/transferase [Armatimonadetes bacterium]|nr:sulfatase-like hydrolase/transferase [Armatimonadota bacterium]
MGTPCQVILLMTDTQRTDMLGCYGNAAMHTPHLDRFASQGVRFDRAYTCQPVCGPARAAMFTGTFPHSNGMWGNSMALGDNVKTLGQRVHDQGIHTAYIGKWHLDGGDYFGLGRCPDGWDPDYWYDMRCYLEELSPEDRARSRRTALCEDPDLTEEFCFGHRCSDRAIRFLERHTEEPFCLVVSYDEPHGPFVCPREYVDLYRGYEWPKSPNVWDTLEGKPEHQRIWAGPALESDRDALTLRPLYFLACNSFVDHQLGRVLDAIDRHAPEALVIYTSDHGDALASHCLHGKGPAMYEEMTHIPFLVRWPGEAPAGAVCPHPTSHIDLVPTVLDALGLPQPKLLEGRSMLPAIRDPRSAVNERIFMEFGRFEVDHDGFGGFQPVRAVCDGQYKLVINLLCTDELYDLAADPQELTNLIDSPAHAAARDALHDRLLEWMNQTRDPFRGYCWERRPWRADARPATWAYTGYTRQRENEEYEPRQLDYDTGLPMADAQRPK